MFLPRDGALLVLEGLDAAGKATQAKKLVERFDSVGSSAVSFSFPRYQTRVGQAILRHLKGDTMLAAFRYEVSILSSEPNYAWDRSSEDALAFQCLMLADKCDATVEIEQHLDSGTVVICDRWWQSALAFGAADGLDPDWLVRIHSALPEAWLNIFIDVPPEEALRRRPEARDRYERDREKQAKVRTNYERLWTNAGVDYVKIDGLGTQDDVFARIWKALEDRA